MSLNNKDHYVNFWPSISNSPFKSRGSGRGKKVILRRDPYIHGKKLSEEYSGSWDEFIYNRGEVSKDLDCVQSCPGVLISFESNEDFKFDLERFDLISKGIELRSVRYVFKGFKNSFNYIF